jgi:hypothetical protein
MHPVLQMMFVPTRFIRQIAATMSTQAALRHVQGSPLFAISHRFPHAILPQLLTILLPRRIKGIEIPLDLLVSLDRRVAELTQLKQPLASIVARHGNAEYPPSIANGAKILSPHPIGILLRMSPL